MVWQKVKSHVHGTRITVESKSGNVYPVKTNQNDADMVYSHVCNEKNNWELWAWVEFDNEKGPECTFVHTGNPSGGAPKDKPWEM